MVFSLTLCSFVHTQLVTAYVPSDDDLSCALKPVNSEKNRSTDFLPVNLKRVILPARPGIEGSEYINATYLQVSTCVGLQKACAHFAGLQTACVCLAGLQKVVCVRCTCVKLWKACAHFAGLQTACVCVLQGYRKSVCVLQGYRKSVCLRCTKSLGV